MILPERFFEKLFAALDHSRRALVFLRDRMSGTGRLSPFRTPFDVKSLMPDSYRAPVAVFSVSFILFSTISTTHSDNPHPSPGGEARAAATVHPSSPYQAGDHGVENTPSTAAPVKVVTVEREAAAPAVFDDETPAQMPAPAALEEARAKTPDWTPRDITRGPVDGMEVSITFDGGFNGDEAAVILDTLKERGIRTTIFLTGVFMKRFPGLTRRIVEDGHEVGNHLMTHPHLTEYARNYTHNTLPGVTKEFITAELRGAEELFHEITGARMAPLWRAPYGEVNARIRRWAFEAGYLHVGWTFDYKRRESLDTRDWVTDRGSDLYLTAGEIRDKVLGFGRGRDGVRGGIVLMHMGTGRKTDRASSVLGEMIDGLRERGYRIVRLTSLIEGDREDGHALRVARNLRNGRVVTGLTATDERTLTIN